VTRRADPRSHALAAAGAAAALVACALPWGRTDAVGGNLPPLTYGFDGPALLVFIAAALVLALLALPFATADRPPLLDRPVVLAAVLALGAVGLVIRAVQLLDLGVLGLPDRSPGFWLAALGLVLMLWGASPLLTGRRRD
jgi:hypothetical protein